MKADDVVNFNFNAKIKYIYEYNRFFRAKR